MRSYTNLKHCNVEILVGAHACLSVNHLHLPAYFLRKLAAKFVDFYYVVTAIDPVAFCLVFLLERKIHDIFYVSQLKSSVGFIGRNLSNSILPYLPSSLG